MLLLIKYSIDLALLCQAYQGKVICYETILSKEEKENLSWPYNIEKEICSQVKIKLKQA